MEWETFTNPLTLLDLVAEEFGATNVVLLVSGGHDSLTVAHTVKNHPLVRFVAHINTGIGIQETRDHARRVVESWGVEFREYKATEYVRGDGQPDPQIYEELVLDQGFPGPGHHWKMYQRLKERPLRSMLRDLDRKRTGRTILVSGRRRSESARRMKTTEIVEVWENTKIWVNPIWSWSKADVHAYMAKHGIPRNPVVDLLHMSGECLCGAFAHPGELSEIEMWFPSVAAKLKALEQLVAAEGFDWGWEEGPPPRVKEDPNQKTLPLCSDCQARHTAEREEGE